MFKKENTTGKKLQSMQLSCACSHYLKLMMGISFISLTPSVLMAGETRNTLEEVVVTAQKRTESAQDVPISLLAYNGAAIDKARLLGVEDVAALSPNIMMGSESSSNMHIYIRGIGTLNVGAGAQQSVGFSVDDVFLTRAGAFNQDMFDVERIEVLRGPQGTLYGKNVVGGVVNIINKKASREPYGKLEVGVGAYNLLETKGVINLPIGETMSFRASVNYRKRDGYVDNVWVPVDSAQTNPDPLNNYGQCPDCTGDMDDLDSISGRVSISGNPSDNFSWTLNAYHNTRKSDGVHTKIANVIAGLFTSKIPAPETDNFYEVKNGNIRGFANQDFTMASLRLDYDTSIGTLTSITANQWLNYEEERDVVNIAHQVGADGGAGFRSQPNIDEEVRVFSQEFRLTSTEDDGPFNWIVGAYFSVEDINRSQFRPRRMTFSTTTVVASSAPQWTQVAKRTSIAGFTQIGYAVTDQLNITGGIRYTNDKIDFSTGVTEPLGPLPWITGIVPASELYGPTDSNKSWSEPTGQLSIDYHINDDVMLYGLYSRGFKGGGFQGSAPSEAAALIPFEPEFANNYEVGFKSQLFDNTLMVNFTYFHTDFSDLQIRERRELIPGDPTTAIIVVFNAASAKINGTEFEVAWATPIDGLELSLAGGTLSTTISESPNLLSLDTDLPQAPNASGSVVADYIRELGNDSTLNVNVSYRYTGDFWWDIGNKEPGFEKAYGLLDGTISLTKDDWKFTLWGKNLTKTEYFSFGQSITQTPGTNQGGVLVARIGTPRTWGVTVSREF